MTELNWLKLSGLMHRCIYNNENPQCPFIDFRNQDYFQLSQIIHKLSTSEGQKMLSDCGTCRTNCKAIEAKVIPINNTRNFKIVN